jgi:hypothetical protein
MSTEQVPTPPSTSDGGEQPWGAPQNRPPRRWSTRKTVVAAAIAVVVAGGGGAAIAAASGSNSSSSSAQGGPGGQMQGGPGGQSMLANSLHGEYVVSDGNGGYTTELTQTGTVTAISSTALTAKSDDGYTKTYTIDSSTAVGNNANISSIAAGDTVTVVAKVSGSTVTAETLDEGGAQAGPGGFGQGGHQQGAVPRRGLGQAATGQG